MNIRIQNIKSGKEYDISKYEWENSIVAQGMDYKYKILDDGAPMEVKRLRDNKKILPTEQKVINQEPVLTEVVLKRKKPSKKE